MAPAGSWGPQGRCLRFYVPRHDRHALIIRDLGDRSRHRVDKILKVAASASATGAPPGQFPIPIGPDIGASLAARLADE